jgi:hypothetical protein
MKAKALCGRFNRPGTGKTQGSGNKMGNRRAKSSTFHKLLHLKEADVDLIQELRSKAHTLQIHLHFAI